MAYQSLNIIGSFTAGVPAVHREIGEERSRAEAYRSLMQSQLSQANRESADDVADVEGNERMHIADAPHDRRNPYLLLRRKRKKEEETEVAEPELAREESGGKTDVDSLGSNLDVVI